MEPFTRELCRQLLDAVSGRDVVDAATDYAQHIPLRVIVRMLGFPQEDADLFRRFIRMVLEDVDLPAAEREEHLMGGELDEYIDARIADHLAEPQDDLTTFLLNADLEGEKLSPDHVRGTMVLLMIAGIDTTWSAIGASLWHLAQHSTDRKRLASEPELIGTAIEEFLRAYAPVTMARLVSKDFEFQGCAMKEGGWLLLPFLQKIGAADGAKLRARVVAELKTTFASHYTQVVSLQEALQLSNIAVYNKRATGEKFLINPNKGA